MRGLNSVSGAIVQAAPYISISIIETEATLAPPSQSILQQAFGLQALLHAGPTQDVFHAIVAFMAGVFI